MTGDKKVSTMMGSGLVLPIVTVAVIAYPLGWRPQFNQPGPAQPKESPLELLKAPYARRDRSGRVRAAR